MFACGREAQARDSQKLTVVVDQPVLTSGRNSQRGMSFARPGGMLAFTLVRGYLRKAGS
jgi:hypothetical protein